MLSNISSARQALAMVFLTKLFFRILFIKEGAVKGGGGGGRAGIIIFYKSLENNIRYRNLE